MNGHLLEGIVVAKEGVVLEVIPTNLWAEWDQSVYVCACDIRQKIQQPLAHGLPFEKKTQESTCPSDIGPNGCHGLDNRHAVLGLRHVSHSEHNPQTEVDRNADGRNSRRRHKKEFSFKINSNGDNIQTYR